ncbi:DUF2336 domain-containing protein [Bradyrhizobium sp.]|uniref:DUF2336 domain-containing protein n=1 Tax=Bradyrhizobium sp. TaxID=376 RepID=UPI00343B2B54
MRLAHWSGRWRATTRSSSPGPLLRRSNVIDESALLDIARAKGQPHLLAMVERPLLSSDLTDVVITRGDRETWCGARPEMPARVFPVAAMPNWCGAPAPTAC